MLVPECFCVFLWNFGVQDADLEASQDEDDEETLQIIAG